MVWLHLVSVRADTFPVTTAAALGPGSLTEAIAAANARPGPDTIAFNLPGGGVHTIAVGATGLPEVTDPLTIDGYTQPGATPNTLAVGDNAVILVRIDGQISGDPPMPHHGLVISAGASTVRGLALTGFPALINFLTGELLFDGTAIILQDGGNNTVEGNFIGLSSDELQNGGNSTGLRVCSANNSIGGTAPANRNIVAQNNLGIGIDPTAAGNLVQGNYIGTDPAGVEAMGNGTGCFVFGETTQIGGFVAEAANVISGNQIGVNIGSAGTGNVVVGNFIGTGSDGASELPNTVVGISISGSDNVVGGLASGAGNRIWFNPRGVRVQERDADHPAFGNSILSNSLFATVLKIDLDASGAFDGPTRNDLGDGDTGPNELQNYPIITSTSFQLDRLVVSGGLNSTPSTTFTLQFYTEQLKATANGQIATVANLKKTETITTDAAGIAYFSYEFSPEPLDVGLNATATDAAGNTSELHTDFSVQLANLSSRGHVGVGDNILIAGFFVREPPFAGPAAASKKVLLRGLGPSLAVGGVKLPGRLIDPTLELHDASGAIVAANDNWRSDQEAEIAATGVAPTSDREAAIVADLPTGRYTVQVRGAAGGKGLSLVEIFDLDPLDPPEAAPSSRLVNLSTRARVAPGDQVLIGGLIVRGDNGESVLVRAIGPDLAAEQVSGPLADPTLEVRDVSGTLVAANDDWRSDQEAAITETGLAPNDDRDAATLCDLIPGSYTAIVRGAGESSGIALVEIYDLNPDH